MKEKEKLYKEYLKLNFAYNMFINLYNGLIDIANAPYDTWKYPFGKVYNVCCQRHTTDKAKQTIRAWKELLDDYNSIEKLKTDEIQMTEKKILDKINELNKKIIEQKFNQQKFSAMRDAIFEISNARVHYIKDGMFDGWMRCYKEETVDVAKNCLERINKYID